ncbi:MAG: pSer/pThr/pTyr-binding forkhead associated (FHA) protein [Myxococcota bacterium]|jgi:pSer/pThr/pTyr-binding forkhead associated (FHA) protein
MRRGRERHRTFTGTSTKREAGLLQAPTYFSFRMDGAPGGPRVFELLEGEQTIGRAADADIVIRGDGLSRKHAVVTRDKDEIYCTDLDSKNGVFLNGIRIRSARLAPGDKVQIGSALLILREGS